MEPNDWIRKYGLLKGTFPASVLFVIIFFVSFAYVPHFVFLGDVWFRTQRAAVASRCATQLSHPSPLFIVFFKYKYNLLDWVWTCIVLGSFRRSFLLPTRMMGMLGQKWRISGVQISGMFSLKNTHKISHTVLFNFQKYKHRRGMKGFGKYENVERMLHISGWNKR